jgi:hypothetical protein
VLVLTRALVRSSTLLQSGARPSSAGPVSGEALPGKLVHADGAWYWADDELDLIFSSQVIT